MQKFIIIYTGDAEYKPSTPEEGMKMIEDWKAWYADMGENLLDGGFPFKPGAKMTAGTSEEDTNLTTNGYLLIQAENYEEAMKMAKKGPLPPGGMIHVFEKQEVPGM